MILGFSDLSKIEFPGRAGELQRQGASASLVKELGDNYGRYHGYVTSELAKLAGPPNPKDYKDYEVYSADWARVQNLVLAEVLLRNAREFRAGRGVLDAPYDGKTPLYDDRYGLISAETGKPTTPQP